MHVMVHVQSTNCERFAYTVCASCVSIMIECVSTIDIYKPAFLRHSWSAAVSFPFALPPPHGRLHFLRTASRKLLPTRLCGSSYNKSARYEASALRLLSISLELACMARSIVMRSCGFERKRLVGYLSQNDLYGT